METSGSPAPSLLVVGTFSLTGTPLSRHCAELVASALEDGTYVRTISSNQGAFAESDLRALLATETAPAQTVIYVRTLLAGGANWRKTLVNLRRARRLVKRSERVLTIRSGGRVVEWLAASFLSGPRTASRTLALPAHLCLRSLGTGTPRTIPLEQAEAVCMNHVLQTGAPPLRLTPAHIRHALDDLAANTPLKQTLAPLLPLMDTIPVRAAQDAAWRGGRKTLCRAARIATDCEPGKSVPRLVEHLKAIGAPSRRWRRYMSPSTRDRPPRDRAVGVILRYLAGELRPSDAALVDRLSRPISPGLEMTAIELLGWVATRPSVSNIQDLRRPWGKGGAKQRRGCANDPARRLAMDLIGLGSSETGLSQNMAMSAQALRLAGITHRTIALGGGGSGQPVWDGAQIRRKAVLWHLNADRIPTELVERYGSADAYHIGFLLWELDKLPKAHRLAMKMLDEIWVPSAFLKDIYDAEFDGPVINVGKGIELPPAEYGCLPWGQGPRLLCAFDMHSSVARKNPIAAVEAFQKVFPAHENASLVIKTTPGPHDHWGDPERQLERIGELATLDDRIRLISDHLPFPDLLGLIDSADALLSPHRAEGFGYLPAYALALGTPVIATNWSGSMDVCTAQTAFPVKRRLEPVPKGHSIYPAPGSRWAEVDRDALARALRDVVDKPILARTRALRGQALIRSHYSMDALAARYAARLTEIGVLAPAERKLAS